MALEELAVAGEDRGLPALHDVLGAAAERGRGPEKLARDEPVRRAIPDRSQVLLDRGGAPRVALDVGGEREGSGTRRARDPCTKPGTG